MFNLYNLNNITHRRVQIYASVTNILQVRFDNNCLGSLGRNDMSHLVMGLLV